MSDTFYTTTPIYYVNADPHIGHTYTTVIVDTVARYHRLAGDSTFFLTGTDEHGDKIAEIAAQRGVSPLEIANEYSAAFSSTWEKLGFSFDRFIRTTDPGHKRVVQEILQKVYDSGEIYFQEYEGLYCVGCERFLTDRDIEDGLCRDHERAPEKRRESNYFLRITSHFSWLASYIEEHPDFIRPERYKNEALAMLREESGLGDLCISRPKERLEWGIELPFDSNYVCYVWFDALINYLSGTGFPDPGYDKLWPADLHIIGKGISRFHCVIWPAMLMAAEMPLPKKVWAHGYVQWEGAKMSKTAGIGVSLGSAIERHGPDPLRYFLMREIGFEGDGNFTWDRFDERYTADLADGLGNLASRVLAMLGKYRDGRVPDAPADTTLDASGSEVVARYQTLMDDLDLRGGAEAAWSLVSAGNLFVTQTAPWGLAKAGQDAELDSALTSLARCLYRLAVLVSPFMPEKSDELWSALGQEGTAAAARWQDLANPPVIGAQTTKGAALFPKANTP